MWCSSTNEGRRLQKLSCWNSNALLQREFTLNLDGNDVEAADQEYLNRRQRKSAAAPHSSWQFASQEHKTFLFLFRWSFTSVHTFSFLFHLVNKILLNAIRMPLDVADRQASNRCEPNHWIGRRTRQSVSFWFDFSSSLSVSPTTIQSLTSGMFIKQVDLTSFLWIRRISVDQPFIGDYPRFPFLPGWNYHRTIQSTLQHYRYSYSLNEAINLFIF